MLCDVYVLKTLCFGTLTLCAATFCNITSCGVSPLCVALRYVATTNGHLPEISGDQEYAGDETNIHGNIQPVGK
jgi:hypothetical protein